MMSLLNNFLRALFGDERPRRRFRRIHKIYSDSSGKQFWKGMRTDDEHFDMLMERSPNARREDNIAVKIHNRRIRKHNRRIRKHRRRVRLHGRKRK